MHENLKHFVCLCILKKNNQTYFYLEKVTYGDVVNYICSVIHLTISLVLSPIIAMLKMTVLLCLFFCLFAFICLPKRFSIIQVLYLYNHYTTLWKGWVLILDGHFALSLSSQSSTPIHTNTYEVNNRKRNMATTGDICWHVKQEKETWQEIAYYGFEY